MESDFYRGGWPLFYGKWSRAGAGPGWVQSLTFFSIWITKLTPFALPSSSRVHSKEERTESEFLQEELTADHYFMAAVKWEKQAKAGVSTKYYLLFNLNNKTITPFALPSSSLVHSKEGKVADIGMSYKNITKSNKQCYFFYSRYFSAFIVMIIILSCRCIVLHLWISVH